MDTEDATGTVAHILTGKPRKLITLQSDADVRDAIGTMKEHGISQIPVLDDNGATAASSRRSICSTTL